VKKVADMGGDAVELMLQRSVRMKTTLARRFGGDGSAIQGKLYGIRTWFHRFWFYSKPHGGT
jgi:hypothetical protein